MSVSDCSLLQAQDRKLLKICKNFEIGKRVLQGNLHMAAKDSWLRNRRFERLQMRKNKRHEVTLRTLTSGFFFLHKKRQRIHIEECPKAKRIMRTFFCNKAIYKLNDFKSGSKQIYSRTERFKNDATLIYKPKSLKRKKGNNL